MEMEIPLAGGRITDGVVRLADTVRRPAKESSRRVQSALHALRLAGFYRAPEFLGFDEKNREILSFIEGYVPGDLGENSVEQFYMAIDMARDLHQASRAFAPEGLVLCHDDLPAMGQPSGGHHRLGCLRLSSGLGGDQLYVLAVAGSGQ